MYLNEAKSESEKRDLAMIIEETLRQRYQGVKNEAGVWVTPAFPKLIYVLDEDNDLYMRTNKSMVFTEEVTNKYDVLELKDMIKEHVTLTNSEKGKEILDNFSEYLPKFKKVIPYDYNRMQMAIVQMEEKGLNAEQAQIEAFYASTRG